MNEAMSAAGVDVQIELAAELERCIEASEPSLESAISVALAELTAQLGIPAPARVCTLGARSPRAVRLVVAGRIMPVSLATLRRAWMASAPSELHDVPLTDDDSTLGIPDNWLRRYASEAPSEEARHRAATVVAYLSRLAGDVMALHPGPLLSRDAAAAYLHPPDGDEPVFHSDEGQQVLRELLALGLSLRDRDAIRSVAIGCRAAGAPLETVVEEALARFASDTVEVQLNPEWLSEAAAEPTAGATLPLSMQGTQKGLDSIRRTVEQRLARVGVTRSVELMLTDAVGPGQIRLRINDRLGSPIQVARPGEVAFQAPPTALPSLGRPGRLLVDAASGHQLVAMPDREAAAVRGDGLVPLAADAFLVVAIIRELGPLAARLINVSDVECDLADVEQSHPDLVHSVLLRHTRARLTRIYRGLLAEQVSCRDVWAILNALLRYESIPLPAPGLRLYDNRVPVADPRLGPAEAPVADLVSFVRLQMKGPLVWESGLPDGDRAVVDAYAIDPSLEAALHRRMAEGQWQEEDADDVRRSVLRALGRTGAPADAVLVVPAAVRVALHETLAPELPSLRVIARPELSPEMSVTIHDVVSLS